MLSQTQQILDNRLAEAYGLREGVIYVYTKWTT